MNAYLKASKNQFLVNSQRNSFGKIRNIIKGFLDTIAKEDQRSLQNKQLSTTQLPPSSMQEQQKAHIQTKKSLSELQKGRMGRLDNILGTKTFFYQPKVYQQRLDSQFLMEIRQLKRKYKDKSRSELNWTNPQSHIKIRMKSKNTLYQTLETLRNYPKHDQPNNLADQADPLTIEFLAKQTLFTRLSLKKLEAVTKSIQLQKLQQIDQWHETSRYTYFRPKLTTSLFRIEKQKFIPQLSSSIDKFMQYEHQCTQIISIEKIYQVLKEYYKDQRVAEYLKKVQNNTIEYIISGMHFSQNQQEAVFIIDLLGTKKEYCALYCNFYIGKLFQEALFNLKPSGVIKNGNFYYVRRSEEGGFIELIQRNLQNQEQAEIYKCPPYHELQVFSDTNKKFLFIKQFQYGNINNQKILLLQEQKAELNEIQAMSKCKFFLQTNEQGLIIIPFKQTNMQIQYGANKQIATQINLIPYVSETQLIAQEQIRRQKAIEKQQQLPINLTYQRKLDYNNKKQLLNCKENQFIRDIIVRKTHYILSMGLINIYNRHYLRFLPIKNNVKEHSLLMQGYTFTLSKLNANYESQIIKFKLQTPLLSHQYTYTIWKRQLQQINISRVHSDTINVGYEDNPDLKIHIICDKLYLNTELPVLIFFPSGNEKIDEIVLKKFLRKGVIVVEMFPRGCLKIDTEYFLKGSGENYLNMFRDIEHILKFIGKEFSDNISVYTKGSYSSLIFLLLSIKYPYLFTSVVLQNGVYDTSNVELLKHIDFFGLHNQNCVDIWNQLNPMKLQFMKQHDNPDNLTIPYMERIMISSTKDNYIQSRKLIKKFRENNLNKYDRIYLQEYSEDNFNSDLQNLAFIFNCIKQKERKRT